MPERPHFDLTHPTPEQRDAAQRVVGLLATEFRDHRHDADADVRSLVDTFRDEPIGGTVDIGMVLAATWALMWLHQETRLSYGEILRQVTHNLVLTAQQTVERRGGWSAQAYADAQAVLAAMVDSLDTHTGGSFESATGGDLFRARTGHYVLAWGLVQSLADYCKVHPREACQRLALEFAAPLD